MTILILGPADMHTQRLQQAIQQQGGHVIFLDALSFPAAYGLEYTLTGSDSQNMLTIEETTVNLADIAAIYWYSYGLPASPYQPHMQAILGALAYNYTGAWVNGPTAFLDHQFKVHQLEKAAHLGATVPDTLMTNRPDTLLAFWKKHDGQVIVKDLVNSTVPHRLTAADLTADALKPLPHYPVYAQQWIAGTDVRVHVIGTQCFASLIQSDTDCYKTDQKLRITAMVLPDNIIQFCIRLTTAFQLKLAGLDFRLTPTGAFVFFEVNPSPQYLIFEDYCHYPLTETLAELLLSFKN